MSAADCPFCRYAVATDDVRGPVEVDGRFIFRDRPRPVMYFEPLNPVTPGHLLFVPVFHAEHGDGDAAVTALRSAYEYGAYRQGESPFDSIHRQTPEGREFWSARDLQAVTEYARWEDFMKLVERAKASAANTGANVDQAFSVITEKGAGRPRVDVHLSRYAAYLTVMHYVPRRDGDGLTLPWTGQR